MLLAVTLVSVAATVPAVVLATSVGQLPATAENVNWAGAYSAAEAGLNDYIQQLDAAGNFTQWTRGRATCPATTSNSDDPAFCGWVQLYDQSNPDEWYEYSLPSTNNGGLTLTVSGKAGKGGSAVVRTFSYRIVPEHTFLDDIYWTNYESTDPKINSSCPAEYYSGSNTPPSGCWIYFDSNDILNGPVFSNDTFRVCGSPTFNGPVYSAAGSRGEILYTGEAGCDESGSPGGAGWGNGPQSVGDEPLPTTVAEASAASYVGCYIAGSSATSPADVTMTLTQQGGSTQVTWSGGTVYNVPGNANNCSGSGFTASSLTSALIYVFGNVTITADSTDSGFLTVVAGATDSNGDSATSYPNAGVMTLDGDVTYPSADIQASGHYDADNQDALGLIADYFIDLGSSSGNEPCPTDSLHPSGGLQIDAALLALQDSLYNPHYANGTICPLYIVGSIAQAFRGPVGQESGGQVSSGYEKNYTWDSSLAQYWPPYYLSPTSATWAPASYEECQVGANAAALSSPSC